MAELFVDVGAHSEKVRCTVCERTGYPGGHWQTACRRGHPFQCGECERAFAKLQGKRAHERSHRRVT